METEKMFWEKLKKEQKRKKNTEQKQKIHYNKYIKIHCNIYTVSSVKYHSLTAVL